MTLPRFYLDNDLAAGESVSLPATVAHHALRVLRLRDRAAITLFNGRGGEFEGRLQVARATQASARLERFHAVERESPLRVTLIQAWVTTEKLELIVEKAVELGVASIVLVPAARSVVQLEAERRERRLRRLHDVIIAACCQCGRNRLPSIQAPETLHEGLASARTGAAASILLDPTDAEPTTAALSGPGPFVLVVGPEGGLDDAERSMALRMGYRPVHLGPRILRTETAGLAGLVALQVLGGDLR